MFYKTLSMPKVMISTYEAWLKRYIFVKQKLKFISKLTCSEEKKFIAGNQQDAAFSYSM